MNIEIKNYKIEIETGMYLDTDVYIPQCHRKLPSILFRTPYEKSNVYALFDPITVVKKGFVLVVQDVRGRFFSDGIFQPFENEKSDSAKTIDWILEQSWSNERIYTIGISYEGLCAILAIETGKISGFSPIVSSLEIRNDWFYENNCLKQAFVQSWSHSFAFTDNGNLVDKCTIDTVQQLSNNMMNLYEEPLEEFPINAILPYYQYWIQNKNNDYWGKIHNATTCAQYNVPGFFVTGWYDIFCESTIRLYKKFCEKSNCSQHLVIGPWCHMELFNSVVGEIDYGIYTLEKFSPYVIVDWFKSLENGKKICSQVTVYIMGINKWVSLNKKTDVNYKKIYLQSYGNANSVLGKGRLAYTMGVSSGVDTFMGYKNEIVRSNGGRCIDAIPEGKGGPYNQENLEKSTNTLVYTSDVFEKMEIILGEVQVKLTCRASIKSADYCIKLTAVSPNGISINLLDSCLRIFDVADKIETHTVSLGHIAYAILPGYRIRCDIFANNFPRLDIVKDMKEKDCKLEIFWGRLYESCIILPFLENSMEILESKGSWWRSI